MENVSPQQAFLSNPHASGQRVSPESHRSLLTRRSPTHQTAAPGDSSFASQRVLLPAHPQIVTLQVLQLDLNTRQNMLRSMRRAKVKASSECVLAQNQPGMEKRVKESMLLVVRTPILAIATSGGKCLPPGPRRGLAEAIGCLEPKISRVNTSGGLSGKRVRGKNQGDILLFEAL